MSEINIGGGESGGDTADDSMPGLDELMDQAESAMERLKNNPELAEALGIDVPELNMDSEKAKEAVENDEVSAEFLGQVCRDLEAQGFGETTVSELADYIESNTEQVDALIEQHR